MANDPIQRSADAPLMEYRVYVLNECNRIFSPAQIIEAVTDDGAIETASRLQTGVSLKFGTKRAL